MNRRLVKNESKTSKITPNNKTNNFFYLIKHDH